MQGEEKRRVLIVDNNEDTLQTLQGILENAGFDTQTTWSGREALGLLESQGFDVLLVDDYLPDLHSNDFLTRQQIADPALDRGYASIATNSRPPEAVCLARGRNCGPKAPLDPSSRCSFRILC